MSKKQEIDRLHSMPLEVQATQKEIKISFPVLILIFLCGFVPGLYYWLGDSFIFSYNKVSPFLGFIIFSVYGLLLAYLVGIFFSFYWRDYNYEIAKAYDRIKVRLKNGEGTAEEQYLMKKVYIEGKIGEETLTQEEFNWHTKYYCWGCGRKQIVTPVPYTVTKERTESWKEGGYQYTQKFQQTGTIYICPDCYNRLTQSNQDKGRIKEKIDNILMGLGFCLFIGAIILSIIINDKDGDISPVIEAVFFLVIIILLLLVAIRKVIFWILFSVRKSARISSKTKWSFNEIPVIRNFMRMSLPHNKY